MCQFYKTGRNFNIQNNNRCEKITIGVSWTSLKDFRLSPYGNVSIDDNESPKIVTFSGGISNVNGIAVNNVTVNRSYQLRRTSGAITVLGSSSNVTNVGVSGISFSPSETRDVSNLAINTGDKLCQTISINPANGKLRTDNGSIYGATTPNTTEQCATVYNKPYVSFFGGDVSTCSDIKTFYRPSNKVGSGVQYIAQATGTIDQFTSAFGSNPATPRVLSFANTSATGYGGSFGGTCTTRDYFTNPPAPETTTPPSISANALTPGSKYYNAPTGGLELSAGTLRDGVRSAIYVNGDLRITGNIDYQNTSWPTIADIPSLHVYVKGNIYIQPNVTSLTGFFAAQTGANGTGGNIYTCASGKTRVAVNSLLATCGNQLRVRGGFSSKKTYFDRGSKSLRNGSATETYATSNAAEKFFLGPEMYLVSPGSTSTGGSNATGGYQYETVLPPTL